MHKNIISIGTYVHTYYIDTESMGQKLVLIDEIFIFLKYWKVWTRLVFIHKVICMPLFFIKQWSCNMNNNMKVSKSLGKSIMIFKVIIDSHKFVHAHAFNLVMCMCACVYASVSTGVCWHDINYLSINYKLLIYIIAWLMTIFIT